MNEITSAVSAAMVDLLRRNALFATMGEDILSTLLARAAIQRLAPGEVLFRQGEPGDCAYLIDTGRLEVVVETDLGGVSMAYMGPQEIVGETAVFTDLVRTATVCAVEPTVLLRLERRAMEESVAGHSPVAFALIAALARRIVALNRPLALLSLAAQALEKDRLDTVLLTALTEEAGEVSPFARSFQRILTAMESKQSYRQEMDVARRIQQSILPRRLEIGPGFAIDALLRPAAEVGGDFYDFFPVDDGHRVMFVIGDVSGKGVPAALFMTMVRSVLRSLVPIVRPLESCLGRVNEVVVSESRAGMFATVFIGEIHLASGVLRYCNAGHTAALLVGRTGGVRRLTANGPALGLKSGHAYSAERLEMAPGSVLLAASDGVTEATAPDGRAFGEGRLDVLAANLAGGTPTRTVEAIAAAVDDFTQGCERCDDLSCLALARAG
ncbi:MAG: SpoIIE family protein phosphatase [Magnetospirillum sp.]|nr:SpoIIE family protein phosphatase [Magnetospirillum sp.]